MPMVELANQDGRPFYVNAALVLMIEDYGSRDSCRLVFGRAGVQPVNVRGTMAEVAAALNATPRPTADRGISAGNL